MDTQILKHGSPARLFPVLSESRKEQRTLSIVLATMISVRPFATRLLDELGVSVGKRSTVSCFTEVTLTNEIKGLKDRPDALIVVETRKKSWSALVEAKVKKENVGTDQLERYIELAKANNIDAVLTITNELTPAPAINPSPISKSLPKKIGLFHFSWASILTNAFLLAASKDDPFENDNEVFLISELIRYLEDKGSGRLPLEQMNKDWPKIVSDIQAGHPLNAKSPEIEEMVTMWHQEARDVALIMTRKLRKPVTIVYSRSNIKDRAGWVERDVKSFCDNHALTFELDVPNAASQLLVEADFLRRTIRASMKLAAPTDRKSNAAKLNWVLRQLNKSELSKINITCVTYGRARNFGAMADEIDSSSDEIKGLREIVSFQIEMSSDLGKYFNSRKKFIEGLEDHVPAFYKNVGEHLKAYVAPPPKRQKPELEDDSLQVSTSGKIEKNITVSGRPNWATHWQAPSSGGNIKAVEE